MRILVIEDEAKTAQFLKKGLSESGFGVEVSGDGLDGLHLALEAADASRFEAMHGPLLTPLVGREEEIELLLRRWQRAKSGNCGVS